MKCAKCGNEISPDAPNCPYCAGDGAAGGTGAETVNDPGETGARGRGRRPELSCPRCGSRHIQAGVVMMGGRSGAICRECGTQIQPGRNPLVAGGCGCFIVFVILCLLMAIFGGC